MNYPYNTIKLNQIELGGYVYVYLLVTREGTLKI